VRERREMKLKLARQKKEQQEEVSTGQAEKGEGRSESGEISNRS